MADSMRRLRRPRQSIALFRGEMPKLMSPKFRTGAVVGPGAGGGAVRGGGGAVAGGVGGGRYLTLRNKTSIR
eukprot:scaffold746_cov112-Isochrysis_galbana.AAC.6